LTKRGLITLLVTLIDLYEPETGVQWVEGRERRLVAASKDLVVEKRNKPGNCE